MKTETVILVILIFLLGCFVGYKFAMMKVESVAKKNHLVKISDDGMVVSCNVREFSVTNQYTVLD